MPLHQLTYRSVSRITVGLLAELTDILDAANANNRRTGITGALIYADRRFVQVLEGRRFDVFALYRAISHDPRHTDITLMAFRPIVTRSFADWSMAIATKTRKTAPAFRPYLQEGRFEPASMRYPEIKLLMTDVASLGSYRSSIDWPGSL